MAKFRLEPSSLMRPPTKNARVVAAPASPEPPTSARLAGLDGLRAIAVIVVIGFHFLPSAIPGGYLGVDVFFVISGFLITGLLVRESTTAGRFSLPRFWGRRARRLLPALVLVVALCSAAAFFVGGDVLVGLGSQVLGAATFSSNWLYIAQGASYFDSTSSDLFRNLWSLAVEEQFYLLWPLLLGVLLLITRRWARIGIVLGLAVASGVAMAVLFTPPGDATRVYYGTDTHSFGLALGAALALLLSTRFSRDVASTRVARWMLPPLGALAVGGLVVLSLVMPIDDPLVTRGGLFVVAALTTLAIAGATVARSWLGAGLDIRPLRWVGERSYGLYLWHWPVLVLLAAALPVGTVWWLAPAAALVLTVLLSAASYRWVETPIRRRGVRGAVASAVRRPAVPRLVAAGVSVAVLASFGLTGAAIAADPGKSEAQLAIEEGQAALENGRALSPGHRRPPPLPSGDQIYAIGDSVMLAASPWLQEAFPGITIDASVSRQMWAAPDMVQSVKDAGELRPILILGLGTNGEVDPWDLRAVENIVGPDCLVVVVNGQAPRDWIPVGNANLADFARQERSVELANWHDAIAPRIDELASDQVHPGGPISGGIYVGAIADALQRLAELPPLLDNNDYVFLNRPS